MDYIVVFHKCFDSHHTHCAVEICFDGTIKDENVKRCSFGQCNFFGCYCNGGCTTHNSAIASFQRQYPEYDVNKYCVSGNPDMCYIFN